MKHPQVELLAPASGLEAIRAAIFAGADAVYTGGTRFGARAYADNLVEDELLQAIDFVHLHGKQLYLTVNTLLKEKELEEALIEYLMPYYKRGLDAVIVQDIGVFKVVREHFVDLPVHVSTQAVVTGANSAAYWEKLGASRIVTARELSLEEIRAIRKNINIEIESFVHGALCYCYSGQCLFSSFLGGRSGNRGRCAQPCRLPYELTDELGKVLSLRKDISRGKQNQSIDKGNMQGKERYLLSPKDMCTLDILPDIIEAGVFSLKIEGRMKRPEYTAGVTEIYRKYVDMYLKCKEDLVKKGYDKPSLDMIKEQYRVSRKDKQRLMDLYNRGNFHSGYYTMHNGTEMMSMERPNHNGVYAGTMVKGKRGYSMKAETDLHRQDVLEFRGVADKQKRSDNLELTLERDVKAGALYVLPEKYAFLLGKRQNVEVYRTKNDKLLKELSEKYLEGSKKLTIEGRVEVKEGEALALSVAYGNRSVTVYGDVVDTAQNQPVQQEYIRKQLGKTGNTSFVFGSLDVLVKGNCFVPVKALNELRRTALEQLEEAIVGAYRREIVKAESLENSAQLKEKEKLVKRGIPQKSRQEDMSISQNASNPIFCHVSIEDKKHLPMLLEYPEIDKIYMSIHGFWTLSEDWSWLVKTNGKLDEQNTKFLQELQAAVEQCHNAGKKFYLVMPHILRKSTEDKLKPVMEEILESIDGIVVKNMEALTFVSGYKPDIEVVADYTTYTMNTRTVPMWKEAGATMVTLPVELNRGELLELTANNCSGANNDSISEDSLPWEMVIYGHLPMMVSAQCPVKNTIGCQKKSMITRLKDRKGSRHYVRNYCDTCYTVIYNSEPLYLIDLKEELLKMPLHGVRLQFTVESEEQIRSVLEAYIGTGQNENINYTRGHWKRGVE